MELLYMLNNYIIPNEINLMGQQPVILSDSITIVQGYESQPHDAGISIAWRLSKDGSEVLAFDPEFVDLDMYRLKDWTIANLPDSSATGHLPWDDLIAMRIRDVLIGGTGGTKEDMLANLARWQHDQTND